jgi:carboxylesterase type B
MTKKFGNMAVQSNFFFERIALGVNNDENCLFLNVFTPVWEPDKSNSSKGFPVMVYVHGGGFSISSAAHFGDKGIAKYLVSYFCQGMHL